MSANASPEHSNASQQDDSLTLFDSEKRRRNSTADKKFDSASKKRVSQFLANKVFSDSPLRSTGKKSVGKLAREMIFESRDKGIIQRVIDHIFDKFSRRENLQHNCEIRISFIEIYKEQVTDLLDEYVRPEEKTKSLRNIMSSSFAMVRG